MGRDSELSSVKRYKLAIAIFRSLISWQEEFCLHVWVEHEIKCEIVEASIYSQEVEKVNIFKVLPESIYFSPFVFLDFLISITNSKAPIGHCFLLI